MKSWRDWSVRTRLAWVASLMTILACAAVSVLVLVGVHSLAVSERRHRIIVADLAVSRLMRLGRLPPVLSHHGVAAIQVADPGGRIASATPNMAGKPLISDFTPPRNVAEADTLVCSPPGFPDRCMRMVVVRHVHDTGDWLIYGADPAVPWFVSPMLLGLFIGGTLLLVTAMAYGTYRLVGRALAPVDAVCGELTEITGSDLSRRVPLPPHRDEIRNLAEAVNQTLDRLQLAVERQRRFASDASHDLRSPITAMRTQVEDALTHPEEADWTKMGEAMTASLDRLQAIVTDLLVIARLDSGERVTRDHVDLTELFRAELARAENARRSRGKRIVVDIQPGVAVSGDRLQLVRLLTNLLDNAERHAARTVTVSLRRLAEHAVLEVLDDGEGIRPEHREIVFQRFTRLAASRERDKHGTGLGLAIAREIAERHGGRLTIEDSPGGARFVFMLPALHLPRRDGAS